MISRPGGAWILPRSGGCKSVGAGPLGLFTVPVGEEGPSTPTVLAPFLECFEDLICLLAEDLPSAARAAGNALRAPTFEAAHRTLALVIAITVAFAPCTGASAGRTMQSYSIRAVVGQLNAVAGAPRAPSCASRNALVPLPLKTAH